MTDSCLTRRLAVQPVFNPAARQAHFINRVYLSQNRTAKEEQMRTVAMQPTFTPYHLAVADQLCQAIAAGPTLAHASLNFWNGMVSLIQQGANQQQLEEFLERLRLLLTPVNAQPRPRPITFGSQSADRMLSAVEQARKVSAQAAQPAGPFALLLEQIGIAQRMLRGEEATR